MYSKENVDEKKRNQNEYDINNFLILIFQNKEFEEDLDFFDEQNEEDEDNEDREYNFFRDKNLALMKLSTYSWKLNQKIPDVNDCYFIFTLNLINDKSNFSFV